MTITINPKNLFDFRSEVEKNGFTYFAEYTTKSATGKKHHYEVFTNNKNGKTYYLNGYYRATGKLILTPKDFSQLTNIF